MSDAINHEFKVGIRCMTVGDISTILKIEREVFPDPWSSSAFRDQITLPDWGAIVAESDGRIVGYGCYHIVAAESHLTNLAVGTKYRRKSVAKQLLLNILQVVKEHGCDYNFLEVRPSNRGAIAFYEKFHFEVLYRRPRYYRQPVEDALVMGRQLVGAETE